MAVAIVESSHRRDVKISVNVWTARQDHTNGRCRGVAVSGCFTVYFNK